MSRCRGGLVRFWSGMTSSPVVPHGWGGVKNGELLRRASLEFAAFVTADTKLEYQQNLATLPIAVVVLVANSNRLEDLEPLIPETLLRLATLVPRTLIRVGG